MAGVLLVKDALAVRADGRTRCSILAADGRIVALLRPSDAPSADVVIDAAGRPVIPGGIDPHVHLEAGGQSFEADAATESRAAVTGGITTFFHFLLEQESHWIKRGRRRSRLVFRRISAPALAGLASSLPIVDH